MIWHFYTPRRVGIQTRLYRLFVHLSVRSSVFPYKILGDQILPLRKIDQGQPRIKISTFFVVLSYPLLHNKFQGHRSLGYGENFKVFTIYGRGDHVGHMTWTV